MQFVDEFSFTLEENEKTELSGLERSEQTLLLFILVLTQMFEVYSSLKKCTSCVFR